MLNHKELMDIIIKFLATPDHHLEHRQFALRRQIGNQDGQATKVVAEALRTFLTKVKRSDNRQPDNPIT